jgi:predicted Zn-dependent peptidase
MDFYIVMVFIPWIKTMEYTCKKIAGIDVIFAPMHDAASTTVEILVKAWSLYETQSTNGLSHFLEHMFFKGGKKYHTAKMVVETIDAIGGECNAFTGNEYAWYYVKSAPEHVYLSLDVLGDMMVHPTFPHEEVEKEKWVVIQEINMYLDRPDAQVRNARERNYYGDNSFGRTILGPESNVQSFTQEMLFAHKDTLYTKDSITIVIAGKILDTNRVESMIEEIFAWLPEHPWGIRPIYTPHHPLYTWDIIDQKTNQNHLVYGWPWYGDSHKYEHAASLVSLIVGGTMSSRLFQEVREKRWLCYYIGSSHSVWPDHGTFKIRAGLSKENYQEGVDAITQELRKVAGGDITADELAKAQSNMLGRVQMGIETSDEMADFIGSNYLLYKKVETLDEILENYKKVTLDDIHAASSMVHPDALYGCTIM